MTRLDFQNRFAKRHFAGMAASMTRLLPICPMLARRGFFAGAALIVLAASAGAQRTWVQVTPQTSPSPRFECDMVFDAARNQLVLFSGTDNGAVGMNDTWIWNGTNWIQVFPSNAPSPRWATQLVYDPVRLRVLLFGGHQGAGVDLGDTWEWDGTNWTMRTPATSPPPRANACFAFNPNNGKVLMFGGRANDMEGSTRNDTWEWDGTNWTELFPSTVPPARHAGRMVHDPISGRLLMFAGAPDSTWTNLFADTWTWDGTNWNLESPPSGSPPARNNHLLSYDAAIGRVVLFGGGGNEDLLSDTWEWTGGEWIEPQVLPVRGPVAGHAQEYDPFSGRTMVFGGLGGQVGGFSGNALDETWFYSASNRSPVATDDFYGMNQSNSLSVTNPGVLANDTDPDEDPLTAELVAGPANAESFQLSVDGSFSYTPSPFFFGEDSFTYKVYDGSERSEVVTVHITVSQPGSQGFITGGGKFFQDGRKCTFGFVAKVRDSGVQGQLEFQDHEAGMDVKSLSMQWVYAENQVGYFSGACSVNGVNDYTFFVQVSDLGQPGNNDDFTIWILDAFNSPVYTTGALLTGGNIVIHGN